MRISASQLRQAARRSVLVGVMGAGLIASIATSGSARSEDFTGAIRISGSELGTLYTQDIRLCPIWENFRRDDEGEPAVFELEVWHRGDEAIELPIALRLENSGYEVQAVHTSPSEMQQIRLEIPSEVAQSWEPCSPWVRVEIGPLGGEAVADVIWRFRTEATVDDHGVSLPGSADVPDAYLELRGQR